MVAPMKSCLSIVPAAVWLGISYALLACAIYWSAHHKESGITTAIFFACVFGAWIPAYIYANRKDMALNKVFWISQTAAMAVAIVVLCVVSPWLLEASDSVIEMGRAPRTWGGIASGIVAYFVMQSFFGNLVRRAYNVTESQVEKLLAERDQKN